LVAATMVGAAFGPLTSGTIGNVGVISTRGRRR